jgi:hypothetical protein
MKTNDALNVERLESSIQMHIHPTTVRVIDCLEPLPIRTALRDGYDIEDTAIDDIEAARDSCSLRAFCICLIFRKALGESQDT